jgi:hypothetical protein
VNPLRRAGAWLADTGPVAVLAAIAGAGSFTHIDATATQHGQHGPMAWAIAVCVDLTCVMAARERHRDQHTHRPARRVLWPSLVLGGGVVLSLAANLDQAQHSLWGWLVAATPCGAFLIAVSMLERRTTRPNRAPAPAASSPPPPSFAATLTTDTPTIAAAARPVEPPRPAVSSAPSPGPSPSPAPSPASSSSESTSSPKPAESASPGPAPALLDFARRVAVEHETTHGRQITRDALRARLGVSNALASDLLHHLRADTPQPA